MDFLTGINIVLQTAVPNLKDIMILISIFGISEFYLIVIPLILWCFDKKLGLRLIFLLSISTALNSLLKILFHSPRPYWTSTEVKALASESTFGMPSGHAQISVTFLGCIAAWYKRTSVWIIAIVLILLVGIARLYLGVHFLSDVITGWIAGIIILLVFLKYEEQFCEWFSKKTLNFRIVFAFCASIGFILFAGIAIAGLGSWQVPPEWNALSLEQTGVAINPLSLQGALLSAGLLFGAALGAIVSSEYRPYVVDGQKSQKIIRYFLGIVILFALWFALGPVVKSPGMMGYVMVYARAAVVGIWMTLGAPVLFRKLGLVNRGCQG